MSVAASDEDYPVNDGGGPTSDPREADTSPAAASASGASSSALPVERGYALDCYPYTFSPLLLFAQQDYFDQGYSNYNSVAQFFSSVLSVNMLENVLYERKNMLYEELLAHVATNRMLVTCCIDAHFTAFQIVGNQSLIYYDPLKPWLGLLSGDHFKKFVTFMMMKCGYGDSQHIQDNKDYYTGADTNPTRRMIYTLWRNINKHVRSESNGAPSSRLAALPSPSVPAHKSLNRTHTVRRQDSVHEVRWRQVSLNLDRYVLVNGPRDHRMMSTQQTGNTCYFQTYLFGVLCKVGRPSLSRAGDSVDVAAVGELEEATARISQFLLDFFVREESSLMRPLTNSNFVLDFHRYQEARYYDVITDYLQYRKITVPDYELQHTSLLRYYGISMLHKYGRFEVSSTMASTLNTKSLQPVTETDDALHKLAHSAYYKYRAANLTFGFNTAITGAIGSFCEFNSLRKNQLLAFYAQLKPVIEQSVGAQRTTNQYRDYYFMAQFEVGQRELVDTHHFTYDIDMHALLGKQRDKPLTERVHQVNTQLAASIFYSTQRLSDYDKFMTTAQFQGSRKFFDFFLDAFMSISYWQEFVGLGLSQIVPAEKEINSLTQTGFYTVDMMSRQAWRMEYEFEKVLETVWS